MISKFFSGSRTAKRVLLLTSLTFKLSFMSSFAADGYEVVLSLQNATLSWFSVSEPGTVGGTISMNAPFAGFEGNNLAYDYDRNMIYFMSESAGRTHNLYAASLDGLKFENGTITGSITSSLLRGFPTAGRDSIFTSASYYEGYYYAVENGTNTVHAFDMSTNQYLRHEITLQTIVGETAPNRTYGDIAFTRGGQMWVTTSFTGPAQSGSQPGEHNGEILVFNPVFDASGKVTSFMRALDIPDSGRLPVTGMRPNGLFFSGDPNPDATGDQLLYGYRRGSFGDYGVIDTTTGYYTVLYAGAPFTTEGDLTSAIFIPVPEPSSALFVLTSSMLALILTRQRRAMFA